MPKVSIMPYIKNQYFNNSGVPLAGGKLYTYYSGTSTNKTTYQNPSGTIAHTNPVILDSAGRVAVYLTSGAYKLVLKDADDVTIWTEDGVSISDLVSEVSIVSDLRSLTAGISTFVRTLGYYSINDKGGWTYYWDATSALDDDGGMIIRPNSLPALGRWIGTVPSDEILNVRVYGAVCDGTTDDVSEIQACDTYCNANGLTILIDSYIYVATDPVLLSTIKLLQSAQFKYGSFSPTLKVIIDDNDATQHFSCTSTYAPTLTNQTVYKCEWFGETLTNHPILTACYNLSMNAKTTFRLNTNLIANTSNTNYLLNGEYVGVKKVSLNASATDTSLLTYDSNNMILQSGSNSNQVYLKNSNGYVGVGTDSPIDKLHTYLTNNATVRVSADTGYAQFAATEPDNALLMGVSSGTSYLNQAGAIPLCFSTTNIERMRITAGGNVGIGMTPTEILSINGSSNGTSRIRLYNQTTEIGALGSYLGYLGSGNANDLLLTSPANLAFATSSAVKMMILTDGKVGIGTVSPTVKLDVRSGSINWDWASDLSIGSSGSLISNTNQVAIYSNYYYSDAGRYTRTGGSGGISFLQTTTADAGDIQFVTAPSGTAGSAMTMTERMRLTQAGYLGIGTASPSTALHVVGDETISGEIVATHDSGLVIRTNSAATADNKWIAIAGGGALSVNRGALFNFYGNEVSAAPGEARIYAGNVGIGGAIRMYTGASAERLTILNSGYVGIGNATPSVALDVTGDQKLSGSLISTSTTGLNIIMNTSDGADNKSLALGGGGEIDSSRGAYVRLGGNEYDYGNITNICGGTAGVYTIYTNGTKRLTIKADGGVGIGTDSPSYKLHVVGDTYTSGSHYVNTNISVTGYASFLSQAIVGGNSLWNDSTYKALQISSELHILNNTTGDCRLSANAYYSGGWKRYDAAPASQIQLYYTDGSIRFLTAPTGAAYGACTLTERMILDNTGKLGIGITSSLAALLHIKGTSTSNRILMLEDSADASSSIYGGGIHLRHATTATISAGSGVGLVFEPLSSTGTTYYGCAAIKGIRENATANNQDTAITFWTRAGASNSCTDSEKMRLTSNGDLGIGIGTPTANTKLHVYYNVDSARFIKVENANTGTSAQAYIQVTSGGNNLLIGNTSNNFTGYTGNAYVWNAANTALLLGTNGIERVRVTNVGNMGIGTSATFYAKLAVSVAAGTAIPTLGTGSGHLELTNGLYGVYHGVTSAGIAWIQAHRNDATATAYNLALNPVGGNVGIGTSSPSTALHVSGDETISGSIIGSHATVFNITTNSADGTDNKVVVLSSAGQAASTRGAYVQVNGNEQAAAPGVATISAGNGSTAGYISLATSATERMRLTQAGYVGIGITAPSTKLHVVQPSANNTLTEVFRLSGGYYSDAASNNTFSFYHQDAAQNTNRGVAFKSINGNLNIQTIVTSSGNAANNTNIILQPSDGKVGIGVTPTEKLHVSGNIKLTGNIDCAGTIETTTDYSATSSVSGWSSTSVKYIVVKKYGKLVTVMFNIFGVSNSIECNFTLPYACMGGVDTIFTCPITFGNNSIASESWGLASISISSSIVYCYKNNTGSSNWTNSNNKGVSGVLTYFCA